MSIAKSFFGRTSDGDIAEMITLNNKNGMSVSCINYGANITHIVVPGPDRVFRDVALGFDNIEAYEENAPFFGACIGRHANRIGGAAFTINGVTYGLVKNEGENNLHSGAPWYHKTMYDYDTVNGDDFCAVSFLRISADMEQGYPGELTYKVTYKLTDDNELYIVYDAVSTKDTIFNITNHSYFNLNGEGSGDICDHKVWINAKSYTVCGSDLIPTGEIKDVAGTPFDFTSEKRVGDEIDADFEPLHYGKGYDQNFVIDKEDPREFVKAAQATGTSGITMEVYTDLPGVQFYSGNNIDEGLAGKRGHVYGPRAGLCFETQFFPNSCNIPEFPSCVLKAGEGFHSVTVYKFL